MRSGVAPSFAWFTSMPSCPSSRSTTSVHAAALDYGIEVRTPATLKAAEDQQAFADMYLDVSVVAAYGLILPKEILEAPKHGCLNVHGSLLPRWRGAAPTRPATGATSTSPTTSSSRSSRLLLARQLLQKMRMLSVLQLTRKRHGSQRRRPISRRGRQYQSLLWQAPHPMLADCARTGSYPQRA